ncbi:ATP-binding protein [Streptomyces xantholiticus]|uniref:ATP-binding protein n=1 Tax=Streptomyces xantholiticus TaxID=68285 RepID=A0ABV1UM91_9ACTN
MTTHMPASPGTGSGHADGGRPARSGAKSPPGALAPGEPEHGPDDVVVPRGFSACGLDGDPQNAGRARKFAAHTLHEWALQSLVADVELIVSELVGNAVRHAVPPAAPGTAEYPVWLGLFRYTRSLVCAVTDPSPAPPRMADPGSEAAGGRGLILISALSDTWSWRPTPPRGKTVWASLPLPQGHRTA